MPRDLTMSNDSLNIKRLVWTSLAFIVVLLGTVAYPKGELVLLVGKPGTTESQMMTIVSEAGGAFVSGGKFAWLAVAYAENVDFPSRLRKAGAVLVLDHFLASGCLARN